MAKRITPEQIATDAFGNALGNSLAESINDSITSARIEADQLKSGRDEAAFEKEAYLGAKSASVRNDRSIEALHTAAATPSRRRIS